MERSEIRDLCLRRPRIALRSIRATGPICPTGKSVVVFLSSPICKNISLNPSGKSLLQLPPSCPKRGALRNVINAGRDAVDAGGASDEGAESADGEVVWT